jgi:ribonuclease P protein component
LRTAAQFGQVFAQPKRSSDRYFTVLSRRNKTNTARLGLTVSRRVAKLAVDRNRLKRLAREVFRCQQNLPALDIVVLANKGAPAAENTVLRDSLQRHFDGITKRTN